MTGHVQLVRSVQMEVMAGASSKIGRHMGRGYVTERG